MCDWMLALCRAKLAAMCPFCAVRWSGGCFDAVLCDTKVRGAACRNLITLPFCGVPCVGAACQAYRIQIQSPVKTYSILRRYNDFVALQTSVRGRCWCCLWRAVRAAV